MTRTIGTKNKNIKYNVNVSLLFNGINHTFLEKDFKTLYEVADELGLSYDSVYNIFRGKNSINKCVYSPLINITKKQQI